MRLKLSASELAQVAQLLRFASDTDRRLAHICGVVDNETILWITADSRRLATIRRGTCDAKTFKFAVPKRDFRIAADLCRARGAEHIEIDIQPSGIGVLKLPGVSLQFASRPQAILESSNVVAQRGTPDRAFKVGRADLAAIVHAAATAPPWLTDSARKRFWLVVVASRSMLVANAEWVGHRDTSASARCQATADATIAIDPHTLLDIVEAAPQAELQVWSGPTSDVPLRVAADHGLTLYVMPEPSVLESLRPNFDAVLAEILEIAPSTLKYDEYGRYVLGSEMEACYSSGWKQLKRAEYPIGYECTGRLAKTLIPLSRRLPRSMSKIGAARLVACTYTTERCISKVT